MKTSRFIKSVLIIGVFGIAIWWGWQRINRIDLGPMGGNGEGRILYDQPDNFGQNSHDTISLIFPDGSHQKNLMSLRNNPFRGFERYILWLPDIIIDKNCLVSRNGLDFPIWSPDFESFAILRSGCGEKWLQINQIDGEKKSVYPNEEIRTYLYSWSPDSTKLMLQNEGVESFIIQGVQDPKDEQIIDNILFAANVDWSPDGNWIVYEQSDIMERYIAVAKIDGTWIQRLTFNESFEQMPKWSPDGEKIVFSSNRHGNHDIFVMNRDGSNQTRLTFNLADDLFPDWSPNGEEIVFSSFRDGNAELYRIKKNGSALRRITVTSEHEIYPSWGW